jgi:hypothetical protein
MGIIRCSRYGFPPNKIHGPPSILILLLSGPLIFGRSPWSFIYTKIDHTWSRENRLQPFIVGGGNWQGACPPKPYVPKLEDIWGVHARLHAHWTTWLTKVLQVHYIRLLSFAIWDQCLVHMTSSVFLSKYIFSMTPLYFSSFCFVASSHDNLCMARILNVDLLGGTPLFFFKIFFGGSSCHDIFFVG